MHSSSAYAAPLELDLRPGRFESGLRALALVIGLSVIVLVDFAWSLRVALALLAVVGVLFDHLRARERPLALRLHADGGAELRDQDRGDGVGVWQACTLMQASWYLGCPVLGIRDAGGRAHHCTLLPDRVDAAAVQRLRVWLQTHAPGLERGAVA